MSGFILRLKTWWQTADRTQKLLTVCGGGFLIVLLLGTYIFASRPKMALLYSNLDPEDAGNVAMELDNMGVAYTFDANGNISVPSEKRPQVKANLAMKGKLPKLAGHSGVEDLAKLSPFGDPKILGEQVKAIAESELSQSIQFFDGVDSAAVQVTPAVDSPFDSEKKPAQANVTVSEKSGAIVSADEARAMANLVASAVPGLDTNKVTIYTRSGRQLWDGQEMTSSSTTGEKKLDLEKAEARKRRDQLQDALNKMLGPGNAIAMVDLTLDLDASDSTSVRHDKKPVPARSIEEKMTAAGSGQGAPQPGLTANAPTQTEAGGGAGSSKSGYTVTQTANDPQLWPDTTETSTKHVPGEVKSMSVSVLVNQPQGQTVVNPNDPNDPIVKLANSLIPPHGTDDASKALFPTASVVAYPFDTKQADAAKKADEASASSNRMQQILSVLPIAALLLVAFMVVKSIGKLAARPSASPMYALAGGGPALPMPSEHPFSFAALASPEKTLEGANRFVLPEIVKQKALEAGISEEQLQAAIEEAGDAGISLDDIPSIKSKINVPLEQIKKMANERPETVAMLIKSWLIEEGIRR